MGTFFMVLIFRKRWFCFIFAGNLWCFFAENLVLCQCCVAGKLAVLRSCGSLSCSAARCRLLRDSEGRDANTKM
jgi:hypothetical protein